VVDVEVGKGGVAGTAIEAAAGERECQASIGSV